MAWIHLLHNHRIFGQRSDPDEVPIMGGLKLICHEHVWDLAGARYLPDLDIWSGQQKQNLTLSYIMGLVRVFNIRHHPPYLPLDRTSEKQSEQSVLGSKRSIKGK